MNLKVFRARALTTAAAILLPLGLTACDEDAVTDLTADRPILNLLVAPGTVTLPGGTVAAQEIKSIQNFNFDVPDGFSRADSLYRTIPFNGGSSTGLDMRSGFRNGTQDRRLPVPTNTTAAPGSWFGLYPPSFGTGQAGGYDMWGFATGLKPNTTHTVVFARMALTVNGQLDQNQILTGRPVTDPDRLTFLDGTPTNNNGLILCNFNFDFDATFTGDQNPVVIGQRTSGHSGNEPDEAEFDCIPRASGNSPWFRSASSSRPAGYADSLPQGPKQQIGTVQPGQYNYILLYEGEFAPGDVSFVNQAPAVRIQIGPDIDASGNSINNAFAPFPTSITNTTTFASLPGGSDALAIPGQLTLTLTGLPALSSGQYGVFLVNAETNAFTPVTGRITVNDQTSEGSTFASPGADAEITVVLDETAGVDFGDFSAVAIALTAGGAAPTGAAFLFNDFLRTPGAFTLGTFDATNPVQFRIAGSGGASFFADSLIVQLVGLVKPPAGFHYQSFLVNQVGPNITAELRLHTLETDDLGRVRDVIAESEVPGGFAAFNTYVVVLEPTGGSSLGLAHIQVSENYLDKFGEFFEE